MKRIFIPVLALLASIGLLLIGHGLLLTMLPLRADAHGFSATEIGLTGSSYFLGFVAGCLVVPAVVRRSGHIRTFAALGAVFSAVVLVFELLPSFWVWMLLRFFIGACIAGEYMVIESWLNERATPQTRGLILSVYAMVGFVMVAIGQQLLNLSPQSPNTLFALAAIVISLAIIPVVLTSSVAPAPLQNIKLDLPRVWNLSHIGLIGAIVAGLVTGSFWALAPVYARGVGLETAELTLFISAAVMGGAVFQLPLGRLSDRYDRRLIVFFSSILGAIISLLIVWASAADDVARGILIALSFVWGGCAMTIYAICLAHANDQADPSEFVMVGSAMLMGLGLSSAVGAPLASGFMAWTGPTGLFTFAALCLTGFAVAIAARRRTHVLPVHDETETAFQVVPEVSTPITLELDPRTEEHMAEEEEAEKAANAA